MCGFVGVVDGDGTTAEVLWRMTRSLRHRGPDDWGLLYQTHESGSYVERTADDHPQEDSLVLGMGFQRLSILDLSEKGHQPMVHPSGDIAIVFNGEIYNFAELREKLLHTGHRFESGTDTEVLLRLYQRYHTDMFSLLNGMFAMAIHDRRAGYVLLARDRLGIKPLFVYKARGVLLFASEIKAFYHHPRFEALFNEPKLSELLLFRYVAGRETLLKNVCSVQPGTVVVVGRNTDYQQQYWQIPPHIPRRRTRSELEGELDSLMRSSVRYRLVSDVKVGCQLSGGLDSSLISQWAVTEQGRPFDAVSVVFRDPTFTEEPFVDQVTNQLGLSTHKIELADGFVPESFDEVAWHHDFPVSHPNSFGIFLLAAEAKRHVKVLLSGEGADEVFGGYYRFYLARKVARWLKTPVWGQVALSRSRLSRFPDTSPIWLSAFGDPDSLAQVYRDFDLEEAVKVRRQIFVEAQDADPLERFLTYEQKTYMTELLHRQDRMCMASSIENRVPFLDHRVVEFAKTIPVRHKVTGGPSLFGAAYNTKRILKRVGMSHFGREFAYRKKSGFPLPLSAIYRTAAFSEISDRAHRALLHSGLFEGGPLDEWFESAGRSGKRAAEAHWMFVALGIWWQIFMEGGWRQVDPQCNLTWDRPSTSVRHTRPPEGSR